MQLSYSSNPVFFPTQLPFRSPEVQLPQTVKHVINRQRRGREYSSDLLGFKDRSPTCARIRSRSKPVMSALATLRGKRPSRGLTHITKLLVHELIFYQRRQKVPPMQWIWSLVEGLQNMFGGGSKA